MNNLLKRIVVGVCVALVMMVVHKVSHAASPVYVVWRDVTSLAFPSADALCKAHGATAGPYSYDQMGMIALMTCSAPYAIQFISAASCPDGSNVLGGVGAGVPAYCGTNTPDPPSVTCKAGTKTQFTFDMGAIGGRENTPASDGSCDLSPGDTKITQCWNSSPDTTKAHVMCNVQGTQNGTPSAGNVPQPAPPATPPPDAPPVPVNTRGDSSSGCPAGTENVGTDSAGTPMCRGSGTDAPTPPQTTTKAPTQTTTNPDGSTTTTDSSTTTNRDGSTTTTRTDCTIGADGTKKCTLSGSTTPNASGGAGTNDDGKNDMCVKHPELNVCKNSQVTGNGCSGSVSNVAVTGDAIEGAILRQMRDDNCANQVPSAAKDLGKSLLSGNDPMQGQIDKTKAGDTVDLSSQSLDQSGFLGGGSCFSDRSISVNGRAIPVPFAAACGDIKPLRYAVMACALVVAYLLVSKSVLQG
ncbi:hypothetical protein [Paraherbaspirillum soli]|uniref:TspB protein n=1 Tax=Paraherbaspirillum soli TaxID=631222 RepID=A0ABW0MG11_9BURK